ncbi:MAG: ribosome-associated translation inhibitor RaiA [Polyangiaceae bacterium]
MNIAITFRQMDASDAVKEYVNEKIGKAQRMLRDPMQAQVTVSAQGRVRAIEVELHSGSHRYHVHEESEDMYASIDKAVDKLERQIRSEKSTPKGSERASARMLPSEPDDG